MKSALVFEKDAAACARTLQLLRWIGYLSVPVADAEQLLHVAGCMRFDVVILHTCRQRDDRRSLAAAIKHLSPKTTVVLVTDDDEEIAAAYKDACACVSVILQPPVSLDTLRRKLEYGIDGYGTQREYLAPVVERRSKEV